MTTRRRGSSPRVRAPRARPAAWAALLVLLGCGSGSSGGGGAAALRLPDLEGEQVAPLGDGSALATVFLTLRTDCPISNRYAREIQRIHEEFAPRGAVFWLVYPDPDESPEAIREHLEQYGYTLPALRDPDHALVDLAGLEVTPAAAVFALGREMVYRGRIDDWYVDFGRARPAPTQRDLREVLSVLVAGERLGFRSTPAIGCPIPDLR